MTTPIAPVDIVLTITYIFTYQVPVNGMVTYTPPVGGYVLNNEAEWNATIWTDAVYIKPQWTDILNYSDAAQVNKIHQDELANYYTIKADALGAVTMTALTTALTSYLTTVGAASIYQTKIIPGSKITYTASSLPTNYNTLSGLLGIASGLNDANAAQNDLSAKFAALISTLTAKGILSAT